MSTSISAVLFFLSMTMSFSTGYSIEKIHQGEYLEKAKEATFEVFFDNWMDSNVKKASIGCWITLFENEESLYFGWTTFESLTDPNATIKEFFKTPMKDIKDKFPNYKKVHGNSIREKLELVIAKSIGPNATASVSLGFKPVLADQVIVVETSALFKETGVGKPEKANFKVSLNKNTLDLISVEEL